MGAATRDLTAPITPKSLAHASNDTPLIRASRTFSPLRGAKDLDIETLLPSARGEGAAGG